MQAETDYYYQLIIWGSAIFFVISFFIITFLLLYNRKHKYFREQQQKFSQTLLESQLEIQEQTLKNVSQEIHDNVGQVLTLAKLNLTTLMMSDENTPEQVKNTQQLIAKAISDLRNLSHSLNTDYVQNMGLTRSIEYELEMLQKTGTVTTSFNVEGTVQRLDPQKELIAFRIIQEGIHNIIKHAEASLIDVEIKIASQEMEIIIIDNGKGFDSLSIKNERDQKAGLGLSNMKSRAALIGANLYIESEVGKGTTLKLNIPNNKVIHDNA